MQKRAIETRKKLMTSALEMYVEKGYHFTTVDEVAKRAGLSTGIAYRYFKNKKDLLLASLEDAFDNIQIISKTEAIDFANFTKMEDVISYTLNQFEKLHKNYLGIHEEIESLRHSDKDVKILYDKLEKRGIETLIKKSKKMLPSIDNLQERIYASIALMENYCHMTMDNKYYNIDFNFLKALTIDQVMTILNIK